jgi:raffinose/stachyose/melibiose transport system substrate-binding protein
MGSEEAVWDGATQMPTSRIPNSINPAGESRGLWFFQGRPAAFRSRGSARHWAISGVAVPLVIGLLAACSSPGAAPRSTTASTQPEKPVTLTIDSLNNWQAALPVIVKEFSKLHPNVSFNITYAPSQSYTAVIGTQLSNGTAADLISVNPGGSSAQSVATLAGQGYLKNLSAQPWASKIPTDFKPVVGYDGKVFIPPMTTISVTALYNQTSLDKYKLKIPRTWNQVLSFCAAAKRAGTSAYALGAATDYENQFLVYMLQATLVPDTTKFIAERTSGKVTFTDSAWLQAVQKEQQMANMGCLAKDPLGTDINAAESEVANGQAMAYFGQSQTLTAVQALATNDKFVLTTLPATNNSSQTRLLVAPQGSFGINSKIDPSKLVAAEEFLSYLTTPDVIRQWATITSAVPATPDPKFKPTAASESQAQALASGKFTLVSDQLFPNPTVRTAWITTNEKMLDGQATAKDVVEAMDQAWDGGNQ